MIIHPEHRRRSIRLQGYDYAQPGAYFITLVTHDRACLLGEFTDGCLRLNAAGRMVESCWLAIPKHYPSARLDTFVIMPNHMHGIAVIVPDIVDSPCVAISAGDVAVAVGANDYSPLPRSPSRTIGSIVRGFKIGVTKWFRANTDVYTVWQRNYYEHVIRDGMSLRRIREYIAANPAQWAEDPEASNASWGRP